MRVSLTVYIPMIPQLVRIVVVMNHRHNQSCYVNKKDSQYMLYQVKGAQKETSKEAELFIDANSRKEASILANRKGILVEWVDEASVDRQILHECQIITHILWVPLRSLIVIAVAILETLVVLDRLGRH